MAKNERVRIYNKGTRTWPLSDGKRKDGKLIMVECPPDKSIELNKKQAENLVKDYPNDFLAGEPVQKTNDSKKLKAKVAGLEKSVDDYEVRVAEMTDEIAVFEEKVRDLEIALAELPKLQGD